MLQTLWVLIRYYENKLQPTNFDKDQASRSALFDALHLQLLAVRLTIETIIKEGLA